MIISKDEEIDEDIEHRTKAGWLKWRLAFGMLCERQMPTRLKRKISKTTIRLAMTYGVERWPIKKQHSMTLSRLPMTYGTYHHKCGKSGRDKIRNEHFQEHLGVASIGDKISKTCLR